MSDPRMVWIGFGLIFLTCVVTGLLIRCAFFGCFSPRQKAAEEERIATLVLRKVYEHEQARVYRDWDATHRMNGRSLPPDNAEEDCA